MCCFWSSQHRVKLSYWYPAFSGPKIQRGRRGPQDIREKGGGQEKRGNIFKHELAHWKVVGGREQRGTGQGVSRVYTVASITESLTTKRLCHPGFLWKLVFNRVSFMNSACEQKLGSTPRFVHTCLFVRAAWIRPWYWIAKRNLVTLKSNEFKR